MKEIKVRETVTQSLREKVKEEGERWYGLRRSSQEVEMAKDEIASMVSPHHRSYPV